MYVFSFSPPIALSTRVKNGENQVLKLVFTPFIIDYFYDFLLPPGVGTQVADSSAKELS